LAILGVRRAVCGVGIAVGLLKAYPGRARVTAVEVKRRLDESQGRRQAFENPIWQLGYVTVSV
jgi:hypothetical protein